MVDKIEAKHVLPTYQPGGRVRSLDSEAEGKAWKAGYTPVGRLVFVSVTNGEPLVYRFDVPVETHSL
ncbi:MAG: hypothetical protein L0K44_00265 [Yaniella sp.]|nr:hypothetical protein [Yaniella sp.]